VRKLAANNLSVCRLEALEGRNLLAADFGGGVLGHYAGAGPASDLLAEPAEGTGITTSGDMRRPMPYRGGDRHSMLAPLAPINVAVAASGSARADVSWSDVTANERGFHIYRSDDGTMFHLVATLRARTTEFADLTVKAGKTYQYRVASFNEYGFTMSQAVSVTIPEQSQDSGSVRTPGKKA